VDQGMSALSPGLHCDSSHLNQAQELLSSTGRVVQVPEQYQDAVTAVSGSGPAYVFYVAEAMIEAGVLLGLPRATSTELVSQTLFGAATMLRETGTHPSILREQVTSPGGTTAAALRVLDDQRVRAAFVTAMEAARDRSRALSSGS
jgi:pyrroline-5-carboxylate reductase